MPLYNEADVINALQDDLFLGSGANSRAYEIPGHDLVALAPHSFNSAAAQGLKLTERKDPFPEHNVGQIIARMGEISICKRQRGLVPQSFGWINVKTGKIKESPIFGRQEVTEQKYIFLPQDYDLSSKFSGSTVPVMTPIDKLDAKVVCAEIKRRRNEILDAIDAMPVEAYKQALEEMLIIHSNNHMVDPSKPNNILINPKDQKFGWVDLNDFEKHPEQRPANIEKTSPFYLPFMLSHGVLQNISIGKRMLADPDAYNQNLNEQEKQVLSSAFLKFISALEETPSDNWDFQYTNLFSIDELQRRYGFEVQAAEQVHARIQKVIHQQQTPDINVTPAPEG